MKLILADIHCCFLSEKFKICANIELFYFISFIDHMSLYEFHSWTQELALNSDIENSLKNFQTTVFFTKYFYVSLTRAQKYIK